MGVSRSMKIFMEAMQGSMIGQGYGSKIVHTPMGPFKWDDNQENWVNVNNGFRMPNISMYDLMAIGGDDGLPTPSEGNQPNGGVCQDKIPNYGSRTASIYSTEFAVFPTVTNTPILTCSPNIYVSDAIGIATHEVRIAYSTNSGVSYTDVATYPVGSPSQVNITFPQGAGLGGSFRFKAYKKLVSHWVTPGTYVFYVRNSVDNSIIYTLNLTTTNPAGG